MSKIKISNDYVKVYMTIISLIFEFSLILFSFFIGYLLFLDLYIPLRIFLTLLITNVLFVTFNVISNKFVRTIINLTNFNFLHHFVVLSYRYSIMLSRLILLSKDGTGMPSFFYKLFGLKAGKNCHIGGHIFEPHLITLGNHVHIGYDAILSGHMFNDNTKKMTVGKINIRSNVLIGARSTISPNTQIGDNVIIGAYSFVKIGSNLKANSVYAGIPVKRIKKIQKS